MTLRARNFTLRAEKLNPAGISLSGFSDADDIAPWARDAMKLLVETGIISGSGNRLLPRDTATRAQMAQMLYSLLSE